MGSVPSVNIGSIYDRTFDKDTDLVLPEGIDTPEYWKAKSMPMTDKTRRTRRTRRTLQLPSSRYLRRDQCESDDQCKQLNPDYICDEDTGLCKKGCKVDDDCFDKKVCNTGHCVQYGQTRKTQTLNLPKKFREVIFKKSSKLYRQSKKKPMYTHVYNTLIAVRNRNLLILLICSVAVGIAGIVMTSYDAVKQQKQNKKKQPDKTPVPGKRLTKLGYAGIGVICLGFLGVCVFILLKIRLNKLII